LSPSPAVQPPQRLKPPQSVYARYFPKNPPARSFICVLPWHGPFDVEIDCFARV